MAAHPKKTSWQRRPDQSTARKCPVGLTRSESHVTCRSCIRQGGDLSANCLGKAPARKTEDIGLIQVWWDSTSATMTTTAKLPTANIWHGRPIHIYQAQKRKWRFVFKDAAALWGTADGHRILKVIRYVKYQHHMIKDEDNRIAAIKPLKDVLVEQGVLKDDTDEDVSFNVEQELGEPRVTIHISE